MFVERQRKDLGDRVRVSADTLEAELHKALRRARAAEQAIARIRRSPASESNVQHALDQYDEVQK
jgi:molybdenum cofactor biosynthesis enzyme MoaA